MRLLPFRRNLDLLSPAASSGVESNLEVALAVFQPSIFPALLQSHGYGSMVGGRDPGVAAVKAGHLQLLGWLLRHCPGLLDATSVLEAAARYCDLAGLQAAWGALQCVTTGAKGICPTLGQGVLDAAAGSVTPDAVAKMQWVLQAGGGSCSLADSTARSAVRSGGLDALRWLWECGCPVYRESMHDLFGLASLAMAQLLVDEAGFELPAPRGEAVGERHVWYDVWDDLQLCTVRGPDAAAKLTWLQEREAPLLEASRGSKLLIRLAMSAAKAGNADVLHHLLLSLGPEQVAGHPDWDGAAGSGSIPVLECLRQAGARLTPNAFRMAARRGHLPTLRWLVVEAGLSVARLNLWDVALQWPDRTPAQRRDLREAVQLLVGAGCTKWSFPDRVSSIDQTGDLVLVQVEMGLKPGYQVRAEDLRDAVVVGNETLLEWLLQQPGCYEVPFPYHPSACITPV